jgi:hypothetical protein
LFKGKGRDRVKLIKKIFSDIPSGRSFPLWGMGKGVDGER